MISILIYLIIFCSLLVVLLNSTINALFSLAACYFLSAILLLVLNVEFLALTLIIIYIGALLMLFLFILLLSNIKEFSKKPTDFSSQFFSIYILFSIIFYISKFLNLVSFTSFNIIYNFEQSFIFFYYFQSDIDCYIFLYTDFFI